MRGLLLTFLLATAAVSGAQDRASLDRFAAAYDKAELTGDSSWFLSHLDEKGTVGSGKGKMSHADLVRQAAASKGKRMPIVASTCKTHIDKVMLAGKQATIDYTTKMRAKSTQKATTFRGHAVLVWKKGDWRILQVDSKPIG